MEKKYSLSLDLFFLDVQVMVCLGIKLAMSVLFNQELRPPEDMNTGPHRRPRHCPLRLRNFQQSSINVSWK